MKQLLELAIIISPLSAATSKAAKTTGTTVKDQSLSRSRLRVGIQRSGKMSDTCTTDVGEQWQIASKRRKRKRQAVTEQQPSSEISHTEARDIGV